jgi:hypothetical protein
MPRFLTNVQTGAAILDGVYVCKVTRAVEKVSERGNEMISMMLSLADGRSIPCILTFVEAARPVINAFCSSAELVKPLEDGIEVELTAHHCLGRYLYVVIVNDGNDPVSDPIPRICRFITREQALLIAQIKLQPQAPITLPVVSKKEQQ